jgi:hypothetical protein
MMKNRSMIKNRTTVRWADSFVLAAAVVAGLLRFEAASAASGLDLLSGFDGRRLAACYPVRDSASAGEMAKLLFRLGKADPAVIASRAQSAAEANVDQPEVGDVVEVSGTIVAIRQYKVPETLTEFLNLETFQEIVLASESSQRVLSVFAPPLIGKVSKGDWVRANAIVLRGDDPSRAFSAGRVEWIPAAAESTGWRLLARQGVDLARVAEAGSRNRQALQSSDGDAFYSMLAAAKDLDTTPLDNGQTLPPPIDVDAIELLQSPGDYIGQWIRIVASTVRITRVNVNDPQRREQLGQNHYFQVDASGDLGRTIVQLERGEGEDGEPILMSGSYPVSLVAASLPDFLESRLVDQDAVVSLISQPVSIDGFFYRLWSYRNEFMSRAGGGKQVGPLIVVSRWRSNALPKQAGDGIAFIGYALAAGIFSAIFGTIWWTRRNAREDARVQEQSRGETTIDLEAFRS